MRYLHYLLILLGIILPSCGQNISVDRTNQIILINSTGEKCEVAQLINALAKCNPKVIGLNILLSDDVDIECDNDILDALKNSGQVTLVEGLYDKLSAEMFYEQSMNSGETGLPRHDSDIVSNYYYRVAHYGLRFTFPFLIALKYDTSKMMQLVAKSPRRNHPLGTNKKLEDFKKLTGATEIINNSDLLNGKIVLVGDLSSVDKNMCLTKFTDSTTQLMNRTVLQANIVLDILKDLDSPDVKVSKYLEFIMKEKLKKDKLRE